ncbi:MAG: Gfo/Idh/MocA family oxidoreductase [Bryobacteraceae bacterium]|nr:Gfo/Idh/MocA family oxidoreductase [Bryobacteraceae bacterium]
MTRRHFSLFALAAQAPAAKIRVAMVGTGHGHAASKIRALQSLPAYDFAGLCRPDPHDPAVGAIFSQVPMLRFEDVLRDPSIELIAVEGADAADNLAWATRAVAAGKFVHLDKPPGANLAGLRKLLEDATRRKHVVQMGFQWRYHPAMQAAMQAARQGWLGDIYRFRASIDKPILADERAHLAKYRGGMMFSEGCHLVDRATGLLGKPTRVTGFIHHHGKLNDQLADNNLVILEYPRAIAEISLAGFDPHGNSHRYVEILGTNGSMRAQPFEQARLHVQLKQAAGPYEAGEKWMEPPPPAGLPYTPDFIEMAAIIRQGAKPTYSAEHDLMTHEVLLTACQML